MTDYTGALAHLEPISGADACKCFIGPEAENGRPAPARLKRPRI